MNILKEGLAAVDKCRTPHRGISEMGIRRHAREIAVQALYMTEFHMARLELGANSEKALEDMLATFDFSKACRPFAELLTRGTLEHITSLDRWLSKVSENWTLPRMARVDRALLRVATFELAYISEIPVRVTINEAIEIAKRFCSDDTPMFINGILDRMASLPEVLALREAIGVDNVAGLFEVDQDSVDSIGEENTDLLKKFVIR